MTGPAIALIEAADADFEWMLRGRGVRNGLRLPDGGVDDPAVLLIVRAMTARLHNAGIRASWMAVSDGEVVGLCSYRRPPAAGRVEIGYGVAPARRGQGYATSLVAAIVEAASSDPSVNALIAETAVSNIASQRALTRNGFAEMGTRFDADDGEVIKWERRLRE